MIKLTQKMAREKHGEIPLWAVSTVHRKFQLKTSLKNWPFKQRQCIGVRNWHCDDDFLNTFNDSFQHGNKFIICIKLENMVAINHQSRLDRFRRIFPGPFIWTIANGPSKNPTSAIPPIAESEIFVPELEFEPNEIRENEPLRVVF